MRKRLFTPENISELRENEVFVFGSNLLGNHAGGAARIALDKFGAIQGEGQGLQGKSYAIPTLDESMEKISVEDIEKSLDLFIVFAKNNPFIHFFMTKIGCGIAGFSISEMARLFKQRNFPLNVSLPIEFCVTEGYKVFNEDWTCRGFKYEVGEIYGTERDIECCRHGFHFCEKLVDCYDYYDYSKKNKVAKVQVLGYTDTDDGKKYCTNLIEIVEEVSWEEVDSLVNEGLGNSGYRNSGNLNSGNRNSGDLNSGNLNSGDLNSGDRNSGYRNSGYRNSGDLNSGSLNSGNRNSGDLNSGYRNSGNRNSGDRNSGYRNSGDLNSGDRNSGDRNSGSLNSGNRNSGDRNSGDRNSGDLNSGDLNSGDRNSGYRNSGNLNSGNLNSGNLNSGDLNSGYRNSGYRNSGVFCNRKKQDPIIIFNQPSSLTWDEWYNHPVYDISERLNVIEWVDWSDMTNIEREVRKTAFLTGGYLKVYTYKEAWANLWKTLSDAEKNQFKLLPNYDSSVFEDITGIKF